MNKIISASLVAIFSTLSASTWAQAVTVEVVTYPNQRWHLNRLHASETETGWTISGRLNAHAVSHPPAGHIDVAAYGHDGQLLTETTTAYYPSILTPKMRKKGGLRFSAVLNQALPTGTVVKVAFHPSEKPSDNTVEPVHTANIAR